VLDGRIGERGEDGCSGEDEEEEERTSSESTSSDESLSSSNDRLSSSELKLRLLPLELSEFEIAEDGGGKDEEDESEDDRDLFFLSLRRGIPPLLSWIRFRRVLFQWFLMALAGRPSNSFEIAVHLLPRRL